MKVLSVNVSAVREIDDDGRTVRTGIFKTPVHGLVRVGAINLDGDDQADRKNHGGEHKAVYAFGRQHAAHWREALGRDDIEPGFFGENLSIDTLDERALHVGDRFRAGSALLEITQPRVPCFKLGIRAGDRSLTRAFMLRGLTGAYLRVLEEGVVRAGDGFEPAERDPGERGPAAGGSALHDLATLFAAVHDREGDPDRQREVLRAALEVPALSDEWRALIERRLERLASR